MFDWMQTSMIKKELTSSLRKLANFCSHNILVYLFLFQVATPAYGHTSISPHQHNVMGHYRGWGEWMIMYTTVLILPQDIRNVPIHHAVNWVLDILFCLFFQNVFISFLAVLGLCWARAFSCGEWCLLFISILGLIVVVPSLVEHRL